jgi:hypothetical protein
MSKTGGCLGISFKSSSWVSENTSWHLSGDFTAVGRSPETSGQKNSANAAGGTPELFPTLGIWFNIERNACLWDGEVLSMMRLSARPLTSGNGFKRTPSTILGICGFSVKELQKLSLNEQESRMTSKVILRSWRLSEPRCCRAPLRMDMRRSSLGTSTATETPRFEYSPSSVDMSDES